MKSIVALCLIFVASVAADSHYTDRFDNINLNEILDNRRLLLPYLKCILDQGKCAPDAKELKIHIKEALENNCDKCTDTQRRGTKTVIGHIINKETEYWNQLVAKYDPERRYFQKYEDELKKIN